MKKFIKMSFVAIVTLIGMMATTGCYHFKEVEAWEFALHMADGVSVTEVRGPGRYTDGGFRASLYIIDGQAKQISWSDNDLWTQDKQRITFEVSVTYARNQEYAQMMWEKYNSAAKEDAALELLVQARIPRVAKAVTSTRSLDSMLGREDLQEALKEALSVELLEIGVTLLDIGVNQIGVEPSYAEILSQKAAASIKAELAKEETKTKQEQLLQERAQTEIDLEKARRENLVAEELAKVYNTSPEMLQLELAKIYAEAIKAANTIYLPSESTFNMFNGAIPVESATFPAE